MASSLSPPCKCYAWETSTIWTCQELLSNIVFVRANEDRLKKKKRERSSHPLSFYFCSSSPQYDFVELLDGSRLIAREQRSLLETERAGRQARSVSLHEAGFIQYLDSGIWHLAFYNDGKNAEQVSFNTIVIGKNSLQSSIFQAIA